MRLNFLVFLLSSFFLINGQNLKKDESDTFLVTIFKWEKDLDGKDTKKVIKIDAEGNIEYNRVKNYAKLNASSFNNGCIKFIETEKLIKIEDNDDPTPASPIPQNEEQIINITIIQIKDLIKDEYSWIEKIKSPEKKSSFLKYFKKDDSEVLYELLK